MTLGLAALLLAAVAVVPSADAGDCVVRGRSSCYGGSYYSAPTYYNQAPYYQAPYYYYPKAIEVPVVERRAYYYDSDSAYAASLLADAITLRVVMAQATLGAKPAGVGGGGSVGIQQQDAATAPVRQLQPQQAPRAATAPVAPIAATPVNPKIQAIITSSCIKCHQEATAKNKFVDLSNLATVPEMTRLRCFRAITSGKMPKGAEPLLDSAVPLFDEWAEAAATVADGK